MNVINYHTSGGKDVIDTYIQKLPSKARVEALETLSLLEDEGLDALELLNTRQLKSKVWEIKYAYKERMMYVVADEDNLYILHACKKQKGKAERFELKKAYKRAKELGRELGKTFI